MIPKKFSKYRNGGRGRVEGVLYKLFPSDFAGIEKKVEAQRDYLRPHIFKPSDGSGM